MMQYTHKNYKILRKSDAKNKQQKQKREEARP